MSDVELRDELMTMLAAGHETTATGLAFAFDLLLRNPRGARAAARRARRRGDDDYLNAVATETPAAAAGDRRRGANARRSRASLPAGSCPRASASTRRSRSSTCARTSIPARTEFRPERFLEEEAESYSWLPFGGGIRRCIGAALAQAEMAEVIRIVVTSVEMRPARPQPDPIVLRGITVAPKHGTPVVVERHLDRARPTATEAALAV